MSILPETLATADGETIALDDVDREFAAAMAAPPSTDPEFDPPPDVPEFDPDAPYGRKLNGEAKAAPGGRPPKPRTQAAPKALPAGKGKPQPGPHPDYTEGLKEFLAGIALGLAILPIPKDPIRVRCRVQAGVIKSTADGTAKGLNIVAQHNGVARWAVSKIATGEAAWAFPAAMALMPFALQTAMLWRADMTDGLQRAAQTIEDEAMAEFKAEMGIFDEDQPAAA